MAGICIGAARWTWIYGAVESECWLVDARLCEAKRVRACGRSRREKQPCSSAYMQMTGGWAERQAVSAAAGTGDVCCEEAAPAVGSKAAVGHGGADRVPKRAEERPEEESAERAMGA